jgi:neutral ceramidase
LLTGGVDYRHTYVKMDSVEVKSRLNDTVHTTCPAAIGVSMLAGAEDGPGIGWQGVSCDRHKWFWFLCKHFTTDCQGKKPIVAQTGLKKPPWSPRVLPLQLVRIGDLAIIAVPGEFTTMSGRRVMGTVMNRLNPVGVRYAVIAGLSNAYAGYVTTHEEYDDQRYEGASTHFGPLTLAAYQQEFEKLAVALSEGTNVDPGPPPEDPQPQSLHVSQREGKPPWKEYGEVSSDARPSYHLKLQSTYLSVERKDAAGWTTVAQDRDWETRFIWKRGLFGSKATVEWHIPVGTLPGMYRIRHDGAYRDHNRTQPYSGVSREFQVN